MEGLDHVVIGAATLAQGARHVEELLGVAPGPGGAHAGAGTHNLLMGLGPGLYLEVIAPDPDQPEPAAPRLFGLDDPAVRERLAARPAPLAWVARTDGLAAMAALLGPDGLGPARLMRRGGLSWTIAEPPPGAGFDGLLPAMIEWDAPGAPPAPPDGGCRLLALEGEHPHAGLLSEALRARGLENAMTVRPGPRPRLIFRFRRPDGIRAKAASA